MKKKYLKARSAWKLKHGKFSWDLIKDNMNAELLSDTVKLLILLGEYRNQHRKYLKSRPAVRRWRLQNRVRYREYDRIYKQKYRARKREQVH